MALKVLRAGVVIRMFKDEQTTDWEAWMQNYARRANGDEKPDVAVDSDGSRWVQLGYVLVPEEDV